MIWYNQVLPVGSGTVRSGAGATGGGLPNEYDSCGDPGQLPVPMAAARWTLVDGLKWHQDALIFHRIFVSLHTHKSPAVRLLFKKTGICSIMISSILRSSQKDQNPCSNHIMGNHRTRCSHLSRSINIIVVMEFTNEAYDKRFQSSEKQGWNHRLLHP